MKTIYFISGLPRSGSTLLANILAQNPRFHAGATSGLIEIMFSVRNQWDKLPEFQAMPEPLSKARKRLVLRSILFGYYGRIRQSVIFDKSRGWLAHIEMLNAILPQPAKIIVPIRDLRDILASFEKLWRAASAERQIAGEGKNYFQFQTVAGRCQFWMRPDQPVGLAYNRLKDAVHRGHSPSMLPIPYEYLTQKPQSAMRDIYSFLGEPFYQHNFNHVEQVTIENDRVHGFDDLHTIKTAVTPQQPQWPTMLGSAADEYARLNNLFME